MRHLDTRVAYQVSPVGGEPYYNIYFRQGVWWAETDEYSDAVELSPDTMVEVVRGEAVVVNEPDDLAALMKNKKLHVDVTLTNHLIVWFSDEPVSLVDYLDDEPDWTTTLAYIIRGEQFLYKIGKVKTVKLGKLQNELEV